MAALAVGAEATLVHVLVTVAAGLKLKPAVFRRVTVTLDALDLPVRAVQGEARARVIEVIELADVDLFELPLVVAVETALSEAAFVRILVTRAAGRTQTKIGRYPALVAFVVTLRAGLVGVGTAQRKAGVLVRERFLTPTRPTHQRVGKTQVLDVTTAAILIAELLAVQTHLLRALTSDVAVTTDATFRVNAASRRVTARALVVAFHFAVRATELTR